MTLAAGCVPIGGTSLIDGGRFDASTDAEVSDGAVEMPDAGVDDDGAIPPDGDLDAEVGDPDADLADEGVGDGALLDSAVVDAEIEPDATIDAEVPEPVSPRCPEVLIEAPPAGTHPFYTQYVNVRGLPLFGGPSVPADAFRVAVYTLENMLAERPCAREAIEAAGIRFGIMGPADVTTDMPEYSDFYEAFPGTDWDNRGRGFGATLERPLTTGGAENLLQVPGDPSAGENIFLHEVAHTFFEFGVEDLIDGPVHRAQLEALYNNAMAAGLWANTYAATNANEYWAEAVQSHFNNNLSAEPADGVHNHVDTRAELEAYDPAMAAFVAARIGTRDWDPYCDPDGAGPAWTPPPIEPAVCTLRVSTNPEVGCNQARLTSQNSNTPVEITVVNQGLAPVRLFWIDYQGQGQPLAQPIGPRQRRVIQSFATHGWATADANNNCVRGFSTPEQTTRILLP